MHFVSTDSQVDQVAEVCRFLKDNVLTSVASSQAADLKSFNTELTVLEENEDYLGILNLIY